MSQNSLVIPNTGTLSGLALVNDANGAIDTLSTLQSGGSAPSTPAADMFWMDTTNALLKQRDAGNANWIAQRVRGFAHGGGMRHSGESSALTSNTTLTAAAYLGSLVVINPSSTITITLPVANTFPAGVGMVLANYGTAPANLALQGADTSDAGAYLNCGDSLVAISNGSNKWRLILRGNNGSAVQSGSFGCTTGTAYGTLAIGSFTVTYSQAFAAGYSPFVMAYCANSTGGGVSVLITASSATGFAGNVVSVTNGGTTTVSWNAR